MSDEGVVIRTPITETTAYALFNDAMPHSGHICPPGDASAGELEFDGITFTIIRDSDIPPARRKRMRAKLPIIRHWWWR